MLSKEQLAHELAMVYMNNKYGIHVSGRLYANDGYGEGSIETAHFPDVSEAVYTKVGTGETGFLGIEKKMKVQTGHEVDPIFSEMVENYYGATTSFWRYCPSRNLCKRPGDSQGKRTPATDAYPCPARKALRTALSVC